MEAVSTSEYTSLCMLVVALPKISPFTHLISPGIRDAQMERIEREIASGVTHCATNTPLSGFIVP